MPKPESAAYRFLTVVALCGELPANQIERIPGSTSYNKIILTHLKKAGLLLSYAKNKIRGYRLSKKAKTYLNQSDPAGLAFFLNGFGEYDALKYEVSKRIRYHRVAQTLITMLNADVLVHRSQKIDAFAPEFQAPDVFYVPAFFTSREVKAIGDDAIKVRGSRMVGVLMTVNDIFTVYNFAESTPKLDIRSETRVKAFLEYILCHHRFYKVYKDKDLHGLLFGNNIEMMAALWATADKTTLRFLLRESGYEHIYYLTNDRRGEVLLRLLCDPDLRNTFYSELLQGLTPAKEAYIGCDAFDGQNRQVMFACLPDLPRLYRYIGRLADKDQCGVIVCFDFQAAVFKAWGGDSIEIQTVSFSGFERRYFPPNDPAPMQ